MILGILYFMRVPHLYRLREEDTPDVMFIRRR